MSPTMRSYRKSALIRQLIAKSACLDIDNLFLAIANNLDITTLFPVVQLAELALYLPVAQGTNNNDEQDSNHNNDPFDPI